MKSWTTIENLGKLRIEQSLIEIDTPLLFVCMDKNKSRYMVMCIDDDEYEYLISRVSNEDIIHLIQTGRRLLHLNNTKKPIIERFLKKAKILVLSNGRGFAFYNGNNHHNKNFQKVLTKQKKRAILKCEE